MNSNPDPSAINSLNQEISSTPPQTASNTPKQPPLPAPPILEKDSRINHRNVILVLITILLLSTLIGALFLIQFLITRYQLRQHQAEPSPTPSITANPSPDPTYDWQTYQSQLYGYEIKFPPDWKQTEHSSNFENITSYQALDDSQFEIISTTVEPSQSLTDYLTQYDEESKTGYEGKPSRRIISTQSTQLAGIDAVERDEEWLAAGFTVKTTFVKLKNQVHQLVAIPTYDEKGNHTDSAAYQNYSLILSTFQETTPPTPTPSLSNTDNWQTHQVANAYSFKFPPEAKIEEIMDVTFVSQYGPTQKENTEFYDGLRLGFQLGKLDNRTLEQVAQEALLQSAKEVAPLGGTVSESLKTASYGKLKGFSYQVNAHGTYQKLFLLSDSNPSVFLLITNLTADPNTIGYQKIADEIVSSIQFLL